MKRPLIYPVFLPQQGCPHRCVYCNQHAVTGLPERDPWQAVRDALRWVARHGRKALESHRPGEIAFYGGTFTALEDESLRVLLGEAGMWTKRGAFTGIRFSTRPDALGDTVLSVLSDYPVRTVEIGAQSLDDAVLEASGRGHDGACVSDACRRVRSRHWRLGLQLMVGLPEETEARWRESVLRAVDLGPHFVRIYPALVLFGTALAKWYRRGRYRPLGLEEAVERCAWAADQLDAAGIPIARMGLHPDPALDAPGAVLAGPRHPAFGYLVRSRQWRRRVDAALVRWGASPGRPPGEIPIGWSHNQPRELLKRACLIVKAPLRRMSEVIGPGRSNVIYWKDRWGFSDVRAECGRDLEVVVRKLDKCERKARKGPVGRKVVEPLTTDPCIPRDVDPETLNSNLPQC
ncbi:Radical SAM superfamily protein [Desulfacinum hydrothermale DSM 13146]|uniref:Radical SAM superfamily protein n=1 Tax=Desulfacinum hydrothermale DSM 13146 TaxID=1121390 RepID=A0A1W1X144_9BACT|nr:radical SAM protein [Desulfacinum hydrothermale]SMC17448.1 Radical SAM superfamily protein [Desulfacinum hydrothermale DSM 13146]